MTPPPPIPVDELLAQAGWVRRLARRLAHDAQSADDLAQGALTSAIEKPPTADRPLRPWLARVVTNLARKERRGAARRTARERQHAQVQAAAPATDRLLAEMEEQQRIAQLVGELREPYRTALLLHYYRGQPASEIAETLDIPAATVRSQLARGVALLRERVAAQHGGDPQRALGAALLAAGLVQTPLAPGSSGTGLAALTSKTLLVQRLLVMNTSTKLLAAAGACALVVTGVLGLRALEGDDPITPDSNQALSNSAAPLVDAPQGPAVPQKAESGTREALVDVAEAGAPQAEDETAAEPEELGPTVFVARAVDGDGLPIEGAAFQVVTKFGEPRAFGAAITSGVDGRVEIVVENKAFFTYSGRDTSNTYMALGAPAHAKHFFVPAAKKGTRKDLGDIVLKPGATLAGRVIDIAGAPVEGAVVVGTAHVAKTDAEKTRISGPEREGGRPTTLTDHLGNFTLEGVHVGSVVAWANDTRMAWVHSRPFEVAAGELVPGIELVLEELPASALVAGVVVDPEGAAVPKALVRYSGTTPWGGDDKLYADASGAFVIPIAHTRTFKVMAADPDGEFGASAEQLVQAGDVDLRIELPKKRSLRIVAVRASDGEPIERCSTISMPIPEQSFFMNSNWEYTDADGVVELSVPGEPFRVSIGHTHYVYQQHGPYDPNALPEEIRVELEQKPMIHGVVHDAGEKPVAGALIDLVESTGDRFRPLRIGLPLRIFDGGLERATSEDDGSFALPTNEHGQADPVLLVTKEGYALSEVQIPLPEAQAGAENVIVRMTTGGALEGRVTVGPRRSPESVVVLISRGDGRAKMTRPDASGYYRFDNLTPGDWRVEDRDAEPEARVFGMAQGDEHPFRWDCVVREGETSEYDLDLRWQDDLRVTGRITFDGAGPEGWTATLAAPDHADRPWPERPVNVDAEGRFSLEARPGYAKLFLRAPAAEGVVVELEHEILIDQLLGPIEFAFETAAFEGTLEEGAQKLRLWHRLGENSKIKATFHSGDDGHFRLEGFPAGEASFQNELEGSYGLGFYPLGKVDLKAGETLQFEQ